LPPARNLDAWAWQLDGMAPSDPGSVIPVKRFHGFCERTVARLPLGLSSVVAPTFLGFVLINGLTFGVDLLLLTVLHAVLHLPVPVAVTAAYACAFGLSFFLNRALNFRSHAPAGPQIVGYALVVLVNYLAFILAATTLMTTAGVDYRIARIVAGLCEAVYMYGAMRWVVFRRSHEPRPA
jgi:putative flippase GtrA